MAAPGSGSRVSRRSSERLPADSRTFGEPITSVCNNSRQSHLQRRPVTTVRVTRIPPGRVRIECAFAADASHAGCLRAAVGVSWAWGSPFLWRERGLLTRFQRGRIGAGVSGDDPDPHLSLPAACSPYICIHARRVARLRLGQLAKANGKGWRRDPGRAEKRLPLYPLRLACRLRREGLRQSRRGQLGTLSNGLRQDIPKISTIAFKCC